MKILFKLRYLIPFILFIFTTVLLLTSYFVMESIVHDQLINTNKKKISERLNYLQVFIEDSLFENKTIKIQRIISSYASEQDVNRILYFDFNGVVQASNYFSEIGNHFDQYREFFQNKRFSEVKDLRSARIYVNDKLLHGFTFICDNTKTMFRKKKCGILYFQIDLNYHFLQAKENLFSHLTIIGTGILSGALILILVLNNLITNRAEYIIGILNRFTMGERGLQIVLKGNDEIVAIGRSINKMIEKIVKSEKDLLENEKRLRTTVDNLIDGLITINSKGEILSFNPAASKIFGYEEKEVLGENIKILMIEPHRGRHDKYLQNYLNTGIPKIIGEGREVEGRKKNGKVFPVQLGVSEMLVSDEKIFIGTIRDITQEKILQNTLEELNHDLKEANTKLKLISLTDALTGLYNRRHFDQTLDNEMRRALRQRQSLSLILCDIDHFKKYNDYYGHQEGDECLKKVADYIKDTFRRSGEVACRYGGEEFAIILPNCSIDTACERAETLRLTLYNADLEHTMSDRYKRVTLSLGVACYNPNEEESKTIDCKKLIEKADEKLYSSKEKGRNYSSC